MNQEDMGQTLSDVADGRANEQQLQALLKAWGEDKSLRREWQTLHLIGGALRSPDLAPPVQSGEALLGVLRERIAREPVPLRKRGWSEWLPAVGVAAAFVTVALLLPGLPRQQASTDFMAQAPVTPALAQALVEPPTSRNLDGAPSFVQAIVAPTQPGLLTEPSVPKQALLRADPIPLAHAASSGMP